MNIFLLVGLGGALGAVARFAAGRAIGAAAVPVPAATLLVNVAGGLLMGVLAGWVASRGGADAWRLFLGVGVLGGFTTFSAFSLDMVMMLERGAWALAAGYAAASVLLSVGATSAGLWLVRTFS